MDVAKPPRPDLAGFTRTQTVCMPGTGLVCLLRATLAGTLNAPRDRAAIHHF